MLSRVPSPRFSSLSQNLYSLALLQLNANHLKVNGRTPPQGFTLLLTGQFTSHFRKHCQILFTKCRKHIQSHSNIKTHTILIPNRLQSQTDKHPLTPTTQSGREEREHQNITTGHKLKICFQRCNPAPQHQRGQG